MSGAALQDFIQYWEAEGAAYARHGDYAWMAAQVPGSRVLEIGCGLGFGTQALVERGLSVLALDRLEPCLAAAQARLTGAAGVRFLMADLEQLDAPARQTIEAFRPDVLVCWLMGAPQDSIPAGREPQAAVTAFRERMHRRVAQLALELAEVRAVHIVDRTAIPWQAKDLGRDTLVRYHQTQTFAGLAFSIARQDALYRKLAGGGADLDRLRRSHPALRSVTPVLASLLARRTTS